MPEKIILTPEERKKRIYFANLGLKMRQSFELHIAAGLWDRSGLGEKDWQNVSRHCLVECARAEILADVLHLSETVKGRLLTAAILHDFNKRQEVELARKKGGSWKTYEESGVKARKMMTTVGVENEIQEMAGAAGHESWAKTEQICQKDNLSEAEIAYLIIAYIDEYTIDDKEVASTSLDELGHEINDLDRRINRNETHPNYQQLNEDGRQYFNGKTTYQAERIIADLLEKRIARLILEITGATIEPKKIPEWVEDQLKKKIRFDQGS